MNKTSGIRINSLKIKNYKKINSLEINFPRPLMTGDADILVFGSKNGGGKTSVLECCALLVLAGILGKSEFIPRFRTFFDVSILIKAGESQATIEGVFEQHDKTSTISLKINKNENGYGFSVLPVIGEKSLFKGFDKKKNYYEHDYFLSSILAFSSEPLVLPPLLHFNSYRKVQESNPELGMMAEDYQIAMQIMPPRRVTNNPVSSFKLEILRSLMDQAALFEGMKKDESTEVLAKLNELISRYCGGTIDKLRPLPDNRVDIRIQPITGGESFSFDGLSSGQKEIIATLFLIWRNTQEQPCIVLIDEPELHLNAQWHGDFVRQLHKLAPHNQYILATHSEEMFDSVDEAHRAVLVPDEGHGESV